MNNLKLLRKEAGLTLRELDDYLGISHSVITYLENEDRQFRQIHIDKLTAFFNVTADFLLGKTDNGYIVHTQIGDDVIIMKSGEYNKLKDKITAKILKRDLNVNVSLTSLGNKETMFIPKYYVYREISGDIKSNNLLEKELMSMIKSMSDEQMLKTKKLIEEIIL